MTFRQPAGATLPGASLTRRRLLATAPALAGLGAGLSPALAAGTSAIVTPTSILRPDGSVLARDVRNFWGVNVNPTNQQPDAIAGMMDLIGTRSIRCHPVLGAKSTVPGWQALQAAMVARKLSNPSLNVLAPVVAYMGDLGSTFAMTQAELIKGRNFLWAIEGPNEYNNLSTGGGTHGPADARNRTSDFAPLFLDWCKALNAWWMATPALMHVLLVAPSLAVGAMADAAQLANVSALVHLGNAHFYAGRGGQPNYGLAPSDKVAGGADNVVEWAQRAQMGGKPIIVSECGATTDSNNYARDGVSQAKYMANQLLEFARIGVQRAYIYDLIDDNSRPGDTEGNFGLFRRDGTPKPVAIMLGNLKHLLSLNLYDDPANLADHAPVTPGYDASRLKVTGGDLTVRHLVLPKSDGSTIVAVWNEARIDDGKGTSLDPAPQQVTINLGETRTYSVHDLLGAAPLTGSTPGGGQFAAGSTVMVSIRGYPMLVEVKPR